MTTSRLFAIVAYHGFLVKVFRYSFFSDTIRKFFNHVRKRVLMGVPNSQLTTNLD